MTRPGFTLAAAACVFMLAGCQSLQGAPGTLAATAAPKAPVQETVAVEAVVQEPAPAAEPEACDVLDSRDWEAWINRMPGPGAAATVHVAGKVDMRSGGYTFRWEEGPMDRSAVPALRLKLVPEAPDGMATTAITTEAVAYQAPALAGGYSRVVIGCGGTTLGAAPLGDAALMVDGDGVLTLTGANGTEVMAKRAATIPVLAGTDWTVDAMGGAGLVSGKEPAISFTEDGRINGSTGCNLFMGGYEQDGPKLTFTATGATRMACMDDGVMAKEAAFLAILGGAAEVTFGAGPSLTVLGANGVSFTALPSGPAPVAGDPAQLQGEVWIAEDINRCGVIDNSRLTLAFGADGKVSGSDHCNRFNGTYTADGSKLTLSPLASTRRACISEALSDQARKYTGALGGELAWRFTPDGALLLTGADAARIVLRR